MEAQEIQQKELHTMRGELALLVAVLINSFGVVLMLHSGAGISAISSVPFAFSECVYADLRSAHGHTCSRASWCLA